MVTTALHDSQSLLICFLCCLTNVFSPGSFVIFWLHLEPLRLQPLLLIWAPKSFSVFLFFHIPDLEWTRFLRPNALQFALCVYILPSRCRLAIYSFVLMSSVHLNKPLWVFFSFLFFFVIHTPFSYVSKLSLNNESRITKEDLVLQLSAMTLSAKLTKTTFKCWEGSVLYSFSLPILQPWKHTSFTKLSFSLVFVPLGSWHFHQSQLQWTS